MSNQDGAKVNDKIQAAVDLGQQAVKKVVKDTVENFNKAVGATKGQTEKMSENVLHGFDDAKDFQKKGNETLNKVVEKITNNAESAGKDAVEFLQRSAENNIKAFKESLSAKSVQEAVDVQVQYATNAYRELIEEFTKSTNTAVSLFQNVGAPIQEYVEEVSKSVEKNINK